MAPNDSWFNRQIQAGARGVSNFTGGVVTAVGNGVSGAGRGAGNSITNSTRGWGDSVRAYGNSVKDATGASGPRSGTADNPLGMSRSPASVKAQGQAIAQKNKGAAGTSRDPLGLGGKF